MTPLFFFPTFCTGAPQSGAPVLFCGRSRGSAAAGENARPTLRPGASGDRYASANRQARRRADEIIGPYAEGRRDTACRPRFRHPFALHCRAGVHARRGGLAAARKDIGKIMCRTPPPSLTRCHLPLQGRLYRRQSPKSLPCKGRWMRRKAQTEGCIAAWRWRYPAKPGRPLPSIRRGRCLHRPGNPAMPQSPLRRAKSPALHCGRERAATDTRQPTARPANGPMKIIGPYAGVRRPVSAGNRPTPGHRLPSPVPPPFCLAL